MGRVALAIAAVLLVACGAESTPEARSPSSAKGEKSPAEAPSTPPRPVTSLRRAEVRAAVAGGMGRILQNVSFEEMPSMTNGKFHGFVIQSINPEWGVDLKPGDVVTRVNGIVPEQPADAFAALQSLEKAPSLKVEFEREGKARTLELPIVE